MLGSVGLAPECVCVWGGLCGGRGGGAVCVCHCSQPADQLRELVIPTDTVMQSRATGRAHREELRELLMSYGKEHALQKFTDGELEIPVRFIKDRWQSWVMRGN